ncbi:MAG: thiamine diphosphokinase [Lachnospiraceae bacterium]|jgi:thiamine pyrophosphokinase|nr:thiamine diphosphokinase [Lachnospiraceae bacterium]
MIGRTLILGGGETDYSFAETYLEGQKFDSVVCADSGLAAAKKLGLDVSFFMGDFDSVDKEVLAEYMEMGQTCEEGTKFIKYPEEKDYTDLHLVLEWVTGQQPSEIVILGATGGRLDHFIANVNILMLPMQNNIPAYIIDPYNKLCLINSMYRIKRSSLWGKYISLCPLTEKVTGVCLSGMKYPLTNAVLKIGESIAVSNEMAKDAEEAVISLDKGILVVIESKDA